MANAVDLGNNESLSRGVVAEPDGTFTALGLSVSTGGFKTRRGAARWLERRGRSSTPAARALVGCLALRDGETINASFRLAGYSLEAPSAGTTVRNITRGGRRVALTRNAGEAAEWLDRLGRKLGVLLPAALRRVA
jgi:hypothetical protein